MSLFVGFSFFVSVFLFVLSPFLSAVLSSAGQRCFQCNGSGAASICPCNSNSCGGKACIPTGLQRCFECHAGSWRAEHLLVLRLQRGGLRSHGAGGAGMLQMQRNRQTRSDTNKSTQAPRKINLFGCLLAIVPRSQWSLSLCCVVLCCAVSCCVVAAASLSVPSVW